MKRSVSRYRYLLLGSLLLGCASAAAEGVRPPNIVVIVADDLGYGDVGAYDPGARVRTPHLDALADGGIRFSEAYVSAAVCSPSRAGLMTGRAGTRHGLEFNRGRGLSTDERTLGEMLGGAGYATGAIGKWHLGLEDGRHPLNRGFDEFFGLRTGSLYIAANHPDAVNGPGVANDVDYRTGSRRRPVLDGRKVVEVDEYLTDAFTNRAVDFIDRHAARAFFLYLAYNAPHSPLQTTRKYFDRVSHIEDRNARIYAAMVAALDDGVGRVVERLRRHGVEERTLIVFLSDNGCPLYLDGACSNGPLMGGKRYHHEGGIRVPFIMSWPGTVPGGGVVDDPISTLDLFPTFAALAGADVPGNRPLDGVDLMPFLTGERPDVAHDAQFWKVGPNYAVRQGRWKLVVAVRAPVEDFMRIGGTLARLLNRRPVVDVPPLGRYVMLYDMKSDPDERRNVATENPGIVERLSKRFDEWNRSNVPGNPAAAAATLVVVDGQVIELQF